MPMAFQIPRNMWDFFKPPAILISLFFAPSCTIIHHLRLQQTKTLSWRFSTNYFPPPPQKCNIFSARSVLRQNKGNLSEVVFQGYIVNYSCLRVNCILLALVPRMWAAVFIATAEPGEQGLGLGKLKHYKVHYSYQESMYGWGRGME